MDTFSVIRQNKEKFEDVYITFKHPLASRYTSGEANEITISLDALGLKINNSNFFSSLDQIINNPQYHQEDGEQLAKQQQLDQNAIHVFFHYFKNKKLNEYKQILNKELSVPKNSITVNIKGASGAGKTTLMSNLLNINKAYLATSTNKTTVGTREFILQPNDYSICCTFINQFQVQLYLANITTRLLEAIAHKNQRELKDLRKSFNDSTDQQFRIEQLLGRIDDNAENELSVQFKKFVAEITPFIDEAIAKLPEEHDVKKAKKLVDNVVKEALKNKHSSHFQITLFSLISQKIERFLSIYAIDYEKNQFGWIEKIYGSNINQALCEELICNFSAIKYQDYEWLLTPLVHTMRVAGPFYPTWVKDKGAYNYHFVDGMGVDHNQKEARSIPNYLAEEINESDYIIWIENATKVSGNSTKLFFEHLLLTSQLKKSILVHTHLDKLEGDKYEDEEDKQNAADNNFENAFATDEEEELVIYITKEIMHKTYYFKELNSLQLTEENLTNLTSILSVLKVPIETRNLSNETVFMIEKDYIVEDFIDIIPKYRNDWHFRLNSVRWNTLRAMTARLAYYEDIYGFGPLYPVEEYSKVLWIILYKTLHKSLNNKAKNIKDLEVIAEQLTEKMTSLISDKMIELICMNNIPLWVQAEELSGTGSHSVRINAVNKILNDSLPAFTLATIENNKLYNEFLALLNLAIEQITTQNSLVDIQLKERNIPVIN
ncbi:MAG: hypothetical protein ABS951_15850 [Solibacillus sp.]